MNVFDERNPNSITANAPPHNFQGGVGGEGGGLEMRGNNKFGVETRNNRRALGVLNLKNYAGAQPQAYPCVVSKRLNSDSEGGVCGANPFNPVLHRPITRKFAAQLSSTHQALQETKKKQKPSSVPKPNAFGECIFIDHEDETKVPDIDQPVPMSLEEQTQESSIDQMDHTEEIEMEDIIEEPIMDIDRCDAKNPLAVVDYVEHLYAYYRKMESLSRVSPDYMAQQLDINEKMRAILIDWLVEVHDKFELMKETLFLTVNLIDRFLSQQPVMRKKLQLVGLVAMLLACKYEEVSVPVVGDLIVISDKAYTRKEVLEMENLMLNKLQFNMSLPTPYVFMTRILKAAQSDKKLEMLAFYLIELSLVEYEMLKFTPSLLAASAIYTAQCSLYGFKQWSSTSQLHSNYSEDQLLECSRKIVGFHKQAGTGKLTGVYRKYNTSKFGYTSSKCEPASFLLETNQQQLL